MPLLLYLTLLKTNILFLCRSESARLLLLLDIIVKFAFLEHSRLFDLLRLQRLKQPAATALPQRDLRGG